MHDLWKIWPHESVPASTYGIYSTHISQVMLYFYIFYIISLRFLSFSSYYFSSYFRYFSDYSSISFLLLYLYKFYSYWSFMISFKLYSSYIFPLFLYFYSYISINDFTSDSIFDSLNHFYLKYLRLQASSPHIWQSAASNLVHIYDPFNFLSIFQCYSVSTIIYTKFVKEISCYWIFWPKLNMTLWSCSILLRSGNKPMIGQI